MDLILQQLGELCELQAKVIKAQSSLLAQLGCVYDSEDLQEAEKLYSGLLETED